MHGDNSYRLREFLKKVRNSSVDYDDHWIEKLVKALPKSCLLFLIFEFAYIHFVLLYTLKIRQINLDEIKPCIK